METTPSPRCKFTVISFIIISLSLGSISFIFCIVAWIKRNKVVPHSVVVKSFCSFFFLKKCFQFCLFLQEEDLRWNGKLCYLPTSQAFELGIATLVCFFLAQIIGNSILLRNSYSRWKSNSQFIKMPAIAKVLFLISW